VTRPDERWHLDMTEVWVAEHGWCYLNAAIDCCTREIVGSALDVRCRAAEAITVTAAAVVERCLRPGELTLGTDNGTAFTSRAFRPRLAEQGIAHRRGGYRDLESQAFIESWFGKLKQRCIWREEFETLDEARRVIGVYVDGYHHRPHQRLAQTDNADRVHARGVERDVAFPPKRVGSKVGSEAHRSQLN
jgi:putative transposase